MSETGIGGSSAPDQVHVVLTWTSLIAANAIMDVVARYCDRFEEVVSSDDSPAWRSYAASPALIFTIVSRDQEISLSVASTSLGEPLLRAIFDDIARLVLRTLSQSVVDGGEA